MNYKFLKVHEMNYTTQSQSSSLILSVELARSEVRNALNPEMIKELTHLFQSISHKNLVGANEIRAVILQGQGKVFCAGADLQWMQNSVHFDYEKNKLDAQRLYDLFDSMLNCPVILLAIVQGAAFGGALGLLAASDIVISLPETQFCFSEVKLGIAPAVISAVIAQKNLLQGLRPYMLTGSVFGTNEAIRCGLIHDISNQPEQALEKWKAAILSSGPLAVQETKSLLRRVSFLQFDEQMEMTTDLIAKLRISPEGQEGLTSFLQKRKPSWVVSS